MFYHGANNWFNLNDLRYGALICYGDNPNTPAYGGGYAYVVAFGIADGEYTIQLAVRNDGTMCIRGCTLGNWTNWINI